MTQTAICTLLFSLTICAFCVCTQGQAPDANCDKPCGGNSTEMCGGISRNSVYTAEAGRDSTRALSSTTSSAPESIPGDISESMPWPASTDLFGTAASSDSVGGIAGAPVAIPLFNSTGINCSGHSSCNEDIVQQPFDPVIIFSNFSKQIPKQIEV